MGMSETELQLRREIQTQEVVNKLLQASLEDLSLERTLERAIDCIISAPLFPMKSKGAIFLVEKDPEVLVMRAQRGLSEHLLTACAKIPFGHCLCGQAAQKRSVICAAHVDKDHAITFDGMTPHGHYCVPILLNDSIEGVINLYVDDGHEFKAPELSFLNAVSSVLAGVIQRRRAEQALKETQMQLVQAGKLASIGQLAAGIAHEINNPLSFVSGNIDAFKTYAESFLKVYQYSDALVKSIDHKDFDKAREVVTTFKEDANAQVDGIVEDMRRLFQESEDGVTRIKRIINDLKTFSRSSQNANEEIHVDQVLDQVMRIAFNEIKYKADIRKAYNPVPMIKGDPQKLGQVFMNLLVNASQAIEKRGIITVKLFADEKNIYVSIKDNGCGIPADIIDKIFDPFFTTKPVGVGTGLGLSVSYDIMKKIGGRISVMSAVGKWTEFIVEIPHDKPGLNNIDSTTGAFI